MNYEQWFFFVLLLRFSVLLIDVLFVDGTNHAYVYTAFKILALDLCSRMVNVWILCLSYSCWVFFFKKGYVNSVSLQVVTFFFSYFGTSLFLPKPSTFSSHYHDDHLTSQSIPLLASPYFSSPCSFPLPSLIDPNIYIICTFFVHLSPFSCHEAWSNW